MPWQIRRRHAQGAEPSRSGSPKRNARNSFLAADQWSGSKEYAGLVETSGTAALAVGAVHQIAWCVSPRGRISRAEALRKRILVRRLGRIVQNHRQTYARFRKADLHGFRGAGLIRLADC